MTAEDFPDLQRIFDISSCRMSRCFPLAVLRSLDVSKSNITDYQFRRFCLHEPAHHNMMGFLVSLSMRRCFLVNHTTILVIANACFALKFLDLSELSCFPTLGAGLGTVVRKLEDLRVLLIDHNTYKKSLFDTKFLPRIKESSLVQLSIRGADVRSGPWFRWERLSFTSVMLLDLSGTGISFLRLLTVAALNPKLVDLRVDELGYRSRSDYESDGEPIPFIIDVGKLRRSTEGGVVIKNRNALFGARSNSHLVGKVSIMMYIFFKGHLKHESEWVKF
jgi:hypothetical protein